QDALNRRLASAPSAAGPRIGLTYRDQAGSICRSFSDGSAQGLACRAGNDWRIRGLFQGADGQTGEYRMAAGADPALSALIDSTISGEPFDATAERKALTQGWR
ncbi:MAG TPA: anti-sigma factor, partial [Sphingomicrobium sp.]|nr:anti-sigma factor [Sphingomicrobium sp.]